MPGASRCARGGSPGAGEARRRAGLAAALALFALVDLAHFAPVLRAGAREQVRSIRAGGAFETAIASDHRVVVFEVYRNARALLRSPARFFDAEHCYPTPRSLALGEPMLAMGLLAIPAFALGAEPVLAYNTVWLALPLVAALAMFLLVRDWTGSAAAATLAGLLFGFHPARLFDPVHPYAYDTSWGVLAVFFLGRWLRTGRWRDALALAASVSLQLGASFYALVSAALVAGPLALALLWRERRGRARAVQLAVVLALVAAFASWLFAPYLSLRASGILAPRSAQAFADPAWYLPGARLFPGLVASALALAAFALPAPRDAPARGDPRLALAIGAILAVLVAAGPGWRALAAILPGFETVRGPETVSRGLHLALASLAGIGCARLLAKVPPRAAFPASALVVAAAAAELVWSGALGPAAARRFAAARVAPEARDVAFHEELARAGDVGPILDLPLPRVGGAVFWPGTAPWILLAAHHGRPTSACLSSYLPDQSRLEALAEAVPGPEALRELAGLGFATVVYHHRLAGLEEAGGARAARGRARAAQALAAFEREAGRPESRLRPLLAGAQSSAWSIGPE